MTVKDDEVRGVFTDAEQGEMVKVVWENTFVNFLV